MKAYNRDLLVLVKDNHSNSFSMEFELEQLNQLLFHFETADKFCVAHEVIDMNRYRIHHNSKTLQQLIGQKKLKPFIFLCNKN